MANKVDYSWDGETILQKVHVDDQKMTPKEMLDSIDQTRNAIHNMEDQIKKLQINLRNVENELEAAKSFIKDREPFEEKCVELQKDKLQKLVKKIDAECQEKARIEAQRQINKDKNSMTAKQQENLPYVLYQRYLATHKDVANKISPRIIKAFLFDEPIFSNPFE